MDLSNELISKFVKITNDGNKKESKEGMVYGTTVEYDGQMYVKIDGSDLLTPFETTTDIQSGERVTIMIKDHSATITGNITSPSANEGTVTKKVTEAVEDVEDKIVTEVEILVADRVSTEVLDAEVARIDTLIAEKATIENLEATNAKIENLEVEKLTAVNAEIENLKVNKAEIVDLKATNADIEILDAEVANIQTLVNGNLTSDNILSFHITADKVTMDDAFISDAMIANVSAGKIMAGAINTSLVSVQSEDGSLLINGSTQQFKDANGNVRIQIGKDATGDFTFVLYGADGQGQLINQNGITASAIGNGLIVNDMVSENAAISGGKLDISSVITEINGDTSTTIKSSKIYLNEQNQSLEVAFKELKTQVETIQDVTIDGDLTTIIEQVQSNTTEIEVCKNSISSLVAEDTIIKKQVTDLNDTVVETEETLTAKYTKLEQDVSGFKTTVADTYATKSTVDDLSNNLTVNYSTTSAMNSAINQKANEITTSVSETYATQTYVTNKIAEAELGGEEVDLSGYATKDELSGLSSGLDTLSKQLEGDVSGLTDDINTLNTNLNDLSNNLSINYSTTTQMNSAISQKANEITSSVSSTYATKQSVTDVANNLSANYSTTEQMNSAINQKADEINTSVSKTYATTTSVNNLANNLSANYSTTTQMNSAISQKASEITSSVSSTYATKSELDGETTALENSISTVSQTANKINWVIASGTSSSNMTLTDKVYSLVSNNITLTADHIDLHGYVTANGGFSIDTSGNMTAQNGTFSGNITGSTFSSANDVFQVLDDGTVNTDYLVINEEISTKVLNVETINSTDHPRSMTRAITVYINQNGTDSEKFEHGATFTSIDELIAIAPRNLGGYTLTISLSANYNGNIKLSYFHSGQINIEFNGYTVYGYIYCYGMSMVYRLYGNTSASSSGSVYGKIMPYTGMLTGSYYYGLVFNYCAFSVTDVEFYPDTTNTTNSNAICAERCSGDLYRVVAKGNMRYLVRANYHAYVYVSASSGTCNNATFCSTTGSTIALNKDNTQAGRSNTSGNPYWSGSGGEVRYDGVTFTGTASDGTNTNTGSTTTKSVTYTGTANTYRSTVYNNWKNDSTARQGTWGYGNCTGCWFFGDSFSDISSRNVTKVVITFKRQSGGYNAAVEHKLYTHAYETKPSGAPTLGTSLGTVSVAVGSTGTLTITSSTLISAIKSAKGIGMRHTYDNGHYSVCGSMTIKFYYTE